MSEEMDNIPDDAARVKKKVKPHGNSGHVYIPKDVADIGDEVLIVKVGEEAKEKAFEKGRKKGKTAGEGFYEQEGETSEEDVKRAVSKSLDGMTQSARYANIILPKLREWAGYEDSGIGTYREGGDEDISSKYSEIVDKFRNGFAKGFRQGYKQKKN